MPKGVLVNNIKEVNYALNNFPGHNLITRSSILRNKFPELKIIVYGPEKQDESEEYKSILYLGMNWSRNSNGVDLLNIDGMSPAIIFARRATISFCEHFKVYNVFKQFLSDFDTVIISVNQNIVVKNIVKYFSNQIEWINPNSNSDNNLCNRSIFHPENYDYTKLDGFSNIHILSKIARFIQIPFMPFVLKRKHIYIQDYTSLYYAKKRKDTILPNSLIPWKGYYLKLDAKYIKEAESLFPDKINTKIANTKQLSKVLSRIDITWEDNLLKIFIDIINDIYLNNRKEIIRVYAIYKELYVKYSPKIVSLPGETFFGNIIAALIAKSMGIKTIHMLDGYQTVGDYNLYKDNTGKDYIFDKFVSFGSAHKDLLSSAYEISNDKCVLAEPSILSLHKNIVHNKSELYEAIIMAYTPGLSPTYYYEPQLAILNIIHVLIELGKNNIAIKLKSGDKHLQEVNLKPYLLDNIPSKYSNTFKIDYLTGQYYEHFIKTKCVIGQLSTASVETAFHKIPYYVYEPYMNGKNDDMINSSTITSLDKIARTTGQLKHIIMNKKTSIIDNHEYLFKGPTLEVVNLF